MTAGSFVKRLLRASLILPQGTFPGTGSNTLVLGGNPGFDNIRISAKLTQAGNFTSLCSLDVFGMRQADMQAASVVFTTAGGSSVVPTAVQARALIILEANDAGNWLQVFEGQFQQAQADYRSLPDVSLHVDAATGAGQQYLKAAPSSFSGTVDVAGVLQQLASQMGYAFEDNGVTGQLNTSYLTGTLMDQFREVCESAKVDYYFDAKGTLIVCQQNQPRQQSQQQAQVLSPSSGLIGYVTLQQYGISARCIFSAARELGLPFQLQDSDVPGTNGMWYPFAAEHQLESNKPGGLWFSELQCAPSPESAPQ